MKYGAVILATEDAGINPVSAYSQRGSARQSNQLWRQIDALAFIDQICIVGKDKPAWLQTEYARIIDPHSNAAGLPYYLDCARDFIDDFFYDDGRRLLVAYSNAPYIREHISQLLSGGRDISFACYPADYALRDAHAANQISAIGSLRQRQARQPVNDSQTLQDLGSLIALSSRGWIKWRETASMYGDRLAAVQMPEFLQALADSGTSLNAMSPLGDRKSANAGNGETR